MLSALVAFWLSTLALGLMLLLALRVLPLILPRLPRFLARLLVLLLPWLALVAGHRFLLKAPRCAAG
jgi:hypothetical protein